MSDDFDPLWVPLITHYTDDGQLDQPRTQAHLKHIAPHVRQFLIAGTTGDGWAMPDNVLSDWLDLAAGFGPDHSFLVGAFAPDVERVVARARTIEARLAARPVVARFAGLTLCAPVKADADQREILSHFRAVLAATVSTVAIYQLPQITRCVISPETFAALAADPRVTMFKDTSGEDAVARTASIPPQVRLVRGAEGAYADHLKPLGRYDGWLLSTANGFASELRAIADDVARGNFLAARSASERLSKSVSAIFAAAAAHGGNAFADANRSVDHIAAYGQNWRSVPARRGDGSALSAELIAEVAMLIESAGLQSSGAYLRPLAANHA